MDKYQIDPANAPRIKKWLAERGGILQWKSANLSNPGGHWTTPARDENGEPYQGKPTWQAQDKPHRHITDAAEVEVVVPREVKRFRVAVRMASNSLSMKATDHASRKIRDEVAKTGAGAYHVFDYGTQEAVIYAPDKVVPLSEWIES
jgi:hypothetical protein